MTQPIGIRISDDILKEIDEYSKKESNDRSTIIRKLLLIGFSQYKKQNSADEYIKGKITLSKAASDSGITIYEMEKFLVDNGYKSDYSIEDLEEEMKSLKL